MKKPTDLLVVLDRSSSDHALLGKAATLARRLGAGLELFLCDAEHGYALKHEYDATHNEEFLRTSVRQGIEYLSGLRAAARLDVPVVVSASCESPLYEGIVRKVLERQPGLVMKNASGVHSAAREGL